MNSINLDSLIGYRIGQCYLTYYNLFAFNPIFNNIIKQSDLIDNINLYLTNTIMISLNDLL